MAETAKNLNRSASCWVPDMAAGCSLAGRHARGSLQGLEGTLPGGDGGVVHQCSAAVKAESDYICTSSNAVKIIGDPRDQQILFAPMRHLGRYVMKQKGRDMVLCREAAWCRDL